MPDEKKKKEYNSKDSPVTFMLWEKNGLREVSPNEFGEWLNRKSSDKTKKEAGK